MLDFTVLLNLSPLTDIADSLDPAVRQPDGVAAPGDARVGSLLRPVVVHATVLVVHSEIVGVRLRLQIYFRLDLTNCIQLW